jgi:hypothetical protein
LKHSRKGQRCAAWRNLSDPANPESGNFFEDFPCGLGPDERAWNRHLWFSKDSINSEFGDAFEGATA